MQTVITHPEGVVAGIVAARDRIDISPEQVEQVITRSQALNSLERLQIYGSAYYARLLECLQAEFPALRHALGDETFNSFTFGYLQKYPSQSYTLADLGARFPQYLAESRPPRESESADWADFLIELARLERTYSEVFDGPGAERDPGLTPDELRAIPPDRWPDAKLIPFECIRLMTLSFPVHDYITAVRHGQRDVAPPEPHPTYLAITRREYVVRRYALEPLAFRILSVLLEGRTVGEAISIACASSDVDLNRLAGDVQRWFQEWTAAPFFRRVEWSP